MRLLAVCALTSSYSSRSDARCARHWKVICPIAPHCAGPTRPMSADRRGGGQRRRPPSCTRHGFGCAVMPQPVSASGQVGNWIAAGRNACRRSVPLCRQRGARAPSLPGTARFCAAGPHASPPSATRGVRGRRGWGDRHNAQEGRRDRTICASSVDAWGSKPTTSRQRDDVFSAPVVCMRLL